MPHVSPRTFMCSGLAAAMMRRASDDRPRLSEREQEVLDLFAEGLGTGAIAGRLYMSESTAKTHIARIYQKLGATKPRPGTGHRDEARPALLRAALVTSNRVVTKD